MASASNISLDSTIKLSSGYSMPLLGLGVFQNRGPSVVDACVAGLEAGYRHIDSAQTYGNEKEVVEAVLKSGIKREDVFITTKLLSRSASFVASALTHSVAQLAAHDTDQFKFGYIDLLLIHDPSCGPNKRLEMWRSFIKARDDGIVRSIGVSNFSVTHLQQIADAGLELPSVNQIELHPFCQQKDIVKWCEDHGVVVQAYCPLIRGRKWDNTTLGKISQAHGKEISQVLVRWSLQRGFSPLPKSSQPERVRSNADLYDFHLSNEEMAALDSLDEGNAGAVSWNPVHGF